MRVFRAVCLTLVALLPTLLFAQDQKPGDKDKVQRRNVLIEQILADVPNLKLAENRALAYVKAGTLLWESDQKRARSLFQSSTDELIGAQMAAEANRKVNPYQSDLLSGGSTRTQILDTIAQRDAQLALETLVKTRPSVVAKALSLAADVGPKITNNGNLSNLAQNEKNQEQKFIRMAAEQNPERAARLIEEALKKGLSGETLNLLKKLAEKDADKAAELATQAVEKLLGSKFNVDGQPDYQAVQVTVAFLTEFISDQTAQSHPIKFDASQMRRLAEKLFAYCLDGSNAGSNYMVFSIVPIADKLAPTIVERLKRLAKNGSRWGEMSGYDPDLQKLLSSESTPAQMIAEAKQYPMTSRYQIYQTAANRLVAKGDIEAATDVLNDSFSDDVLADALRNLNNQYANSLIAAGRFAEAERVIDELPEIMRCAALVGLAGAIYTQDQVKNRTYALAVLAKAKTLVEKPDDSNEMSYLMQVIAGYANIEPAEAFRLYEQVVPQLNQIADASATFNQYQSSGMGHDGEFSISQGNTFGFYGPDYSVLFTLARADLDRTVSLIDSFSHRETRVWLKLQMVESGLN